MRAPTPGSAPVPTQVLAGTHPLLSNSGRRLVPTGFNPSLSHHPMGEGAVSFCWREASSGPSPGPGYSEILEVGGGCQSLEGLGEGAMANLGIV